MADALVLDGKTTALVLIDLQHGILQMDVAPISGPEVAEAAATLAAAARRAGALVVYSHVDLNHMLKLPVDKSTQGSSPVPEKAMEVVPEAAYKPDTDVLVLKRQWGAFYGTDLDQQLRRRGIKTIVIGGVATNMGVESTARAAFDQGYELIFAEDVMASLTKEMHSFAVDKVFPMMGRVRTAKEIEGGFGKA